MLKVLERVDLEDLEVKPQSVWSLLGHTNPSEAPSAIQETFQKVMEMGSTLLDPKAGYDILNIQEVTSTSIKVNGEVSFESEDLANRFQEAQELAVFVNTIGSRLEEKVEKLFAEGNHGLGFILDIYGSAAVGTVALKVRDIIDNYVQARGYRAMTYGYCIGNKCPAYIDCGGVVTYWWSPGYGDLPTAEQRKVFTLIDGDKIGVRLSESHMMYPRKSYACLMPIGPQAEKPSTPCVEGEREWMKLGSLSSTKTR